jgi:DNA-binding NarL/FixJ family response regulator
LERNPAPIEESFRRRIEALPDEARLFLLVAAADPVGDPALVRRAAKRLGVTSIAACAQATGLLEIGSAVRFCHPLVRSAVYRAASAGDRQRAHAALADATDPDLDPDRVLWHRAKATSEAAEEVVTEPERSASEAKKRGGLAAAAAFRDRAVEVTLDSGHRAQRALIRVALADDEVLLREGLAGLLERAGLEVVGQSGNAHELIGLVREHRPELVVVDIRMPPTNSTEGLDAARLIREEFPQTAIMILSAHVEVEHAMDLLGGGGSSGYLLKSRVTDVEGFIGALERIVKGESVIDPVLVRELVAAKRVDDPLDEISPREREVLSLVAQGRSNAGIAKQLWVTEGTVEKHVHSILGKLSLPKTEDDHQRVLAVLAFLDTR